MPRAWSELAPLPASDGDWLLPYLRGFGTVGGVVGSQWPRYAALPPTEGQGTDGSLDPTLAAAVREVLARHTDGPGEFVAALWEGWGGLTCGVSAVRLGPGHGCAGTTQQTQIGPALPIEVVNAPRFAPPSRGYLLFAASLHDLAPIPVVSDSNWWTGQQSPSLFWPRSRQWCLGVEIDVVVTLVGGSDALIDELLALPGAVEVDSVERLRREWFGEGFPLAQEY